MELGRWHPGAAQAPSGVSAAPPAHRAVLVVTACEKADQSRLAAPRGKACSPGCPGLVSGNLDFRRVAAFSDQSEGLCVPELFCGTPAFLLSVWEVGVPGGESASMTSSGYGVSKERPWSTLRTHCHTSQLGELNTSRVTPRGQGSGPCL